VLQALPSGAACIAGLRLFDSVSQASAEREVSFPPEIHPARSPCAQRSALASIAPLAERQFTCGGVSCLRDGARCKSPLGASRPDAPRLASGCRLNPGREALAITRVDFEFEWFGVWIRLVRTLALLSGQPSVLGLLAQLPGDTGPASGPASIKWRGQA